MRLKSADTLEDRKSEGKKSAFGKVPIDISKISVKILLPNCFLSTDSTTVYWSLCQ